MALVIVATCPSCGNVELEPQQVELVVYPLARESWSYYSFTCPKCEEEVRKPANKAVRNILTLGGVKEVRPAIPAEALQDHDGPPIGYDCLLDFALWLKQADPALIATAAAAPLYTRLPPEVDIGGG